MKVICTITCQKDRKTVYQVGKEYDIPEYDIDIITSSKKTADIFEEAIALGAVPKKVSNWLMVETMRLMKEYDMDADNLKFTAQILPSLLIWLKQR